MNDNYQKFIIICVTVFNIWYYLCVAGMMDNRNFYEWKSNITNGLFPF